MSTRSVFPLVAAILVTAGAASAAAPPAAPAPAPLFATPDAAMQAFVDAGRATDRTPLAQLFGTSVEDLLSGDAVRDAEDLEQLHAELQESVELRKDDDARYTVLVGKDGYPFPLPIVKQDQQWRFDAKAGLDEFFNRRIGENELSAIATCRAYVLAQWEYFTEADHDSDGVAEYAQRFVSAPGEKNGLYWETSAEEPPSPFGKLVSDARAEGYSAGRRTGPPSGTHRGFPYHGYRFRVLKAQGPHAPGGAYNYIINGNMIAGYALLAYPDKWSASGVMSFIVNQQGRVYQRNLGADTARLAVAMTAYDPDPSWKVVEP